MRALLLGTALALAACASGSGQGPTANNAQASNRDKVNCRMEQPTGSSISREVCRTPEQEEADRKAAEDMFRKVDSRPAFNR